MSDALHGARVAGQGTGRNRAYFSSRMYTVLSSDTTLCTAVPPMVSDCSRAARMASSFCDSLLFSTTRRICVSLKDMPGADSTWRWRDRFLYICPQSSRSARHDTHMCMRPRAAQASPQTVGGASASVRDVHPSGKSDRPCDR